MEVSTTEGSPIRLALRFFFTGCIFTVDVAKHVQNQNQSNLVLN